MTTDDIIRMAREACGEPAWDGGVDWTWEELGRFAALVAAAERLAVKKDIEEEMTDELDDQAYHLCMELIAKILKRGAP
jgi:hypothetical protein